jgi:PAS domain S-box-containing protein
MSDKTQDTKQTPADPADLRKRAEAQVGVMDSNTMSAQTPEAIQQIFHELRVHQIELEMQNEELRCAQAEIAESQARYFDLYDLAPVGYVTVSEKGLILEANLTAAIMLGVNRSTLVKQPLTRFILKEDQDIYYLHRKKLFETGEPQVCEIRLVKPDDAAFWARLDVTVAEGPDGAAVCRVVLIDITARKYNEAERERLITAIEQGDDVVMITDVDGLIQYANSAFETVTGYTKKEVIGQNPRIFKSGKQGETFYREMWNTLTSGNTFHGRMINKRKDGSLYTEDATISPVRDAVGNIVNYVAVKRDVTAHIRLEAQLRQAQKMESVGRLAGGVAHDYNNMLSVIMVYTEMAMDQMDPTGPLYDDLKEIYNAGKRSMEITKQLLAFARKQTIAPKVLDFNETVEGMLKILRQLIGEDIHLGWHPHPWLWPVKMDPSQIDQILANLCVNARDAIDDVGKITIETKNITIDAEYCENHAGFVLGEFVMLAVSDNGCGMDKETKANVFEPFFTTKCTGKGTGLGLATIYGIVKQNNGFINVYSELGHGTTFKIYLPRHVGEIEETVSESAAKLPLGMGEIVLLVEDEPKIIKMGKMMLEKLGYQVLTAETPGRAMNLAREHAEKIDLLMTDVVMPDMNGRDLAEKLQALYPDLKVLFMSGYTANIIAHHGVLEEGLHFIQKPFSVKDLAAKIRAVLERIQQ